MWTTIRVILLCICAISLQSQYYYGGAASCIDTDNDGICDDIDTDDDNDGVIDTEDCDPLVFDSNCVVGSSCDDGNANTFEDEWYCRPPSFPFTFSWCECVGTLDLKRSALSTSLTSYDAAIDGWVEITESEYNNLGQNFGSPIEYFNPSS
jgi:hypothetical protein